MEDSQGTKYFERRCMIIIFYSTKVVCIKERLWEGGTAISKHWITVLFGDSTIEGSKLSNICMIPNSPVLYIYIHSLSSKNSVELWLVIFIL